MPPPSPAPGWASGEVCSERTASLRTVDGTLSSASVFLVGVRSRDEDTLVLVAERGVDLDERLLLRFGERRIPQDVAHEVVFARPFFEDPGADVQRLGRDAEGFGDLLQDLRRGLAEPALDLAQAGIRDAG